MFFCHRRSRGNDQKRAIFLLVGYGVVLLAIPAYRPFWRSVHLYGAALLFVAILAPFIIALAHSHWIIFHTLSGFHTGSATTWFNGTYLWNFCNDLLTSIDVFFILGLIVLWRYRQLWWSQPPLRAAFYSSSVIFIVFLVFSLHQSVLLKFYFPFYIGFVLLFVPLALRHARSWLIFAVIVNALLLLVDSWNVLVPQYGLGAGSNIFYNSNLRNLATPLKTQLNGTDLLVGCTEPLGDDSTMGGYLKLATLAFYLDHPNVYATSPGYFVWQTQPLTAYAGAAVLYVCSDQAPPPIPALNCGATQTVQVSRSAHGNVYASQWYYQNCLVKTSAGIYTS